MPKPNLKGVKQYTPAEYKEKRKQSKEERRASRQVSKRRTIVSSVSILPELKIRIERDIGNGSFSRGVIRAATKWLSEFDQAEALNRSMIGDE